MFNDQSKLNSIPTNKNRQFGDSLDREVVKTERMVRQEPPRVEITKPKVTEPRKYASNLRRSLDEMESTGYLIDKSKFFGLQPDDNLSMKKDAEEFYGGSNQGSPPKKTSYKANNHRHSQENLHSNIQRSRVSNAGNQILRSSSVSRLHNGGSSNPISHDNTYTKGINNNVPYKNKMTYFYSHQTMPKIPNFSRTTKKDDSDVRSTLSYVSEIMRKKKKIFGINEATLGVAQTRYASEKNVHALNPRSLTLAPSTLMTEKDGKSPFLEKESQRYVDLSKEKLNVINDNKYHKKNEMSTLTYNSLTGRYY